MDERKRERGDIEKRVNKYVNEEKEEREGEIYEYRNEGKKREERNQKDVDFKVCEWRECVIVRKERR